MCGDDDAVDSINVYVTGLPIVRYDVVWTRQLNSIENVDALGALHTIRVEVRIFEIASSIVC